MALKNYAYYLRGSQIALVQEDYTNDSRWKSPVEAITDGLEIEYAYSPRYHLGSGQGQIDYNKFYVNGWTAVESGGIGYLALLRSREDDAVNWGTAPESSYITGLTAGDTGGQSKDYIVIRGSSRWNGLHEVDTTGTDYLLLKTRINDTVPQWTSQQIDFNTEPAIFDGGAGTLHLADHFSAGEYLWITGSGNGKNNGLFSVSSVSQSHTPGASTVLVGTRYSCVNSSDSDSASTGLDTEYSATAAFTGETDQTDINVRKAFRDFCYIETNVDALNDESDTIDLPEYLAKALVYYVKAKWAEDRMSIEEKEYYLREFRAIVEKHESSKSWSARKVIPGIHSIR